MGKGYKIFIAIVTISYALLILYSTKMNKVYGTVSSVCVLGDTGKYECMVALENGDISNAKTGIEYEPGDVVLVGENYFGSYILNN